MEKFIYALALLVPAAAHTAEADPHMRALVTDVIGVTSPEVFAFDEVAGGTVIDLGTDSEIRITFYPTCDDVAIRGGQVEIHDDHINIEGKTEILDHIEGNCPGAVKLAESDIINAAVISRAAGISLSPRISLRPTFGVSGANADAYDRLLIRDGRETIAEIPVVGRKSVWPAEAADLIDGKAYAVALLGPDVKPHIAKVIASDTAPALLVLRQ